eukprot:6184783-Pleurochrysis_carterae.AAC.1
MLCSDSFDSVSDQQLEHRNETRFQIAPFAGAAAVRAVLESRGLPFTQFQIANPEIKGKRLYTGPLDFCAAEGECYLPSWVMKQLGIARWHGGEIVANAARCSAGGLFR